ncbi:MAG: hypothetical protein ABEJ28_10790 [Salinigranum sp.]
MRYRCSLCGRESADPVTATRHVSRAHDRPDFGWYVRRVPEERVERVVAWLSNLPLRARCWRSESRD